MTTPQTPGEDHNGAAVPPLPRARVTDGDIHAAKRAWLAAQDGDAPEAMVERLWRDFEELVHTQAQQIADEFRRSHK
jgi:hypothetical protein